MTSAVLERQGAGWTLGDATLPGLAAPVGEWEAVVSCPRRLLVAGEWREARSGRMLTVSGAPGPENQGGLRRETAEELAPDSTPRHN